MSQRANYSLIKRIWLLLCCYPVWVFAWNDTGHMLVADIAYRHLQPQVQRRVDSLVAELVPYYPYSSHSLARAATWADHIKGDVKAYNSWHYINQSVDGKSSIPSAKQNVVWAIEQSEQVLTKKKANRLQQAIFLRLLIHFVGDVHQPLHCASLYNEQFPHGDRGGNAYTIKSAHDNNLHSLWDAGVGLFYAPDGRRLSRHARDALAKQIEQAYPLATFAQVMQENNSAAAWAAESLAIAKNVAYQTPLGQEPSQVYITQGQEITKRQIALAGYRLAGMLNHIIRS